MQLLYDPQLSFTDTVGLPFKFTMNEEESWHCAKVLRLRAGETIFITDGKGKLFRSTLILPHPKGCQVEILEIITQPRRVFGIHIAVAPVKNMGRIEWFLEKATEIGIDEITPLICTHSEKISVRTERLNKVITAAMKQSLGVHHPVLHEPVRFNDFVSIQQAPGKFIGWCEPKDTPLLSDIIKPLENVVILIGPEGDFSPDEVRLAQKNEFIPISLGKNRLRTETAALAACMAMHFVNKSL